MQHVYCAHMIMWSKQPGHIDWNTVSHNALCPTPFIHFNKWKWRMNHLIELLICTQNCITIKLFDLFFDMTNDFLTDVIIQHSKVMWEEFSILQFKMFILLHIPFWKMVYTYCAVDWIFILQFKEHFTQKWQFCHHWQQLNAFLTWSKQSAGSNWASEMGIKVI